MFLQRLCIEISSFQSLFFSLDKVCFFNIVLNPYSYYSANIKEKPVNFTWVSKSSRMLLLPRHLLHQNCIVVFVSVTRHKRELRKMSSPREHHTVTQKQKKTKELESCYPMGPRFHTQTHFFIIHRKVKNDTPTGRKLS